MANELKPQAPDDERVKAIALDVGKDLVEYIEWMHPEMVKACRSWKSARISLRNHVANQIMAHVRSADQGRDQSHIAANEKHRRTMRKIRKAKTVEDIIRARSD